MRRTPVWLKSSVRRSAPLSSSTKTRGSWSVATYHSPLNGSIAASTGPAIPSGRTSIERPGREITVPWTSTGTRPPLAASKTTALSRSPGGRTTVPCRSSAKPITDARSARPASTTYSVRPSGSTASLVGRPTPTSSSSNVRWSSTWTTGASGLSAIVAVGMATTLAIATVAAIARPLNDTISVPTLLPSAPRSLPASPGARPTLRSRSADLRAAYASTATPHNRQTN